MNRPYIVRGLSALLCASALVSISAFSPPESFVPLFNGRNLDGWEVASPGAAWKVNDQILENHRGHSAIISAKKYHNYILIFDWRVPEDDPHENGLLIYIDRGTYTPGQKQPVRTGFFVPGPSIPPNLVGRWNQTRITVEGDRCVFEVNDRVVETRQKLSGGSEAGKVAIGRDGARLDVANIYIKELTENTKAQPLSPPQGFVPVLDIRTIDRWTSQQKNGWKFQESILEFDGISGGKNAHLWFSTNLSNFTLTIDWRVPNESNPQQVGVFIRSMKSVDDSQPLLKLTTDKKPNDWNRSTISVWGDTIEVWTNGKSVSDWGPVSNIMSPEGQIGLEAPNYPIEFAGIYLNLQKTAANSSVFKELK